MTEHEALYRDMGERIRMQRETRGMSQAALGRALGCQRAAISKIESGAVPLLAVRLLKIAQVLSCPVARLCPVLGKPRLRLYPQVSEQVEPTSTDRLAAWERLRAVAGPYFDGVDAEAYQREVRS